MRFAIIRAVVRRFNKSRLVLTAAALLGWPGLFAGQTPAKNPLEGKAESIQAGRVLFELRCAECHGGDATGGLGPDLTVLRALGATDETLFQTVRRGRPGTDMPRSTAPDTEIWSILAYLTTLTPTAPVDESVGDA